MAAWTWRAPAHPAGRCARPGHRGDVGGRRRRTGTPPPPPVRRRRRRLFAAGAPYADRDALADRLQFVDLADFGPLWTVDRFGPVDTADSTPLDALERLAANVGARLLVIDPLYAAFGGSEVDRAHAGAFLTRLRRMAADLSAAVLVVAHPPKGAAGADRAAVSADPSGVSTWRDGVRAVWRMAAVTLDATTGRPADADARRKRPDDCRTVDTLTLDKANYGRIPDGTAVRSLRLAARLAVVGLRCARRSPARRAR